MLYHNCKDIFIGQLIKEKVDEMQIPYTRFARMINSSRTGVYHLFESKTIDIDRLISISNALQYDFIREIYQCKKVETPTLHPTLTIPFVDGEPYLGELPDAILERLRFLLSKGQAETDV